MTIRRIISGGQTGADRAALDAALALGLPIGGWVPKGRRAEDGAIPERYRNLRETDTDVYETRTRWNVRDSDATLILSHGALAGGSKLTESLARAMGKPVMHVDLRPYALQRHRFAAQPPGNEYWSSAFNAPKFIAPDMSLFRFTLCRVLKWCGPWSWRAMGAMWIRYSVKAENGA